jgi:hypothetical protein
MLAVSRTGIENSVITPENRIRVANFRTGKLSGS